MVKTVTPSLSVSRHASNLSQWVARTLEGNLRVAFNYYKGWIMALRFTVVNLYSLKLLGDIMVEYPKNPQRLTPYPNFRFKIKFNNRYVAGVSKISGLTRTVNVEKHRAGGELDIEGLVPEQTQYGPIFFERGLSNDSDFEQWVTKVFDIETSQPQVHRASSLKDFRRDLVIEVYNEAEQLVLSYNVYNAWVSDYHGMADLDAENDDAFVLQTLTLQNEGWERSAPIQ